MDEKTALVTDGHVICHTFKNRYGFWDHTTALIREDGALDCLDGCIVPLPALGEDVIKELSENPEMFRLGGFENVSFIDYVGHPYAASLWMRQNWGIVIPERDARRFFQDLSLVDVSKLKGGEALIGQTGEAAYEKIAAFIENMEPKRQEAFDDEFFEGRIIDDMNLLKAFYNDGIKPDDPHSDEPVKVGRVTFETGSSPLSVDLSRSFEHGFTVGPFHVSATSDGLLPIGCDFAFSSRDGWIISETDDNGGVDLDEVDFSAVVRDNGLDEMVCAAFIALEQPVPAMLQDVIERCDNVLAKCEAVLAGADMPVENTVASVAASSTDSELGSPAEAAHRAKAVAVKTAPDDDGDGPDELEMEALPVSNGFPLQVGSEPDAIGESARRAAGLSVHEPLHGEPHFRRSAGM